MLVAVGLNNALEWLERRVKTGMKSFVWGMLIGAGLACQPTSLLAQGEEGFTVRVPSVTQGDELSRQKSLWVMEVDLKPMRVIWVETQNPETGETNRELFYYICYRAVNRPLPPPAVRETEPVNHLDPEPGPPFFIPEFTLIAEDSEAQRPILDSLAPEALAAINRKERRQFKNSVTIAGPVPEPTTEGANDENALYGVAIFRGIDPAWDHYRIYMTGFSNGYMVGNGPDGEPIMMRKTIEQRFWRPGDEFKPQSWEYRVQGDPVWMYRPDATVAAEAE